MHKCIRFLILVFFFNRCVVSGYGQVYDRDEYARTVALKTNILYDLATILNAEIEVPVSEHLSLTADFIFPWWLENKHQRAFQVNSVDVEARYWFANHNSLTGWYAGLNGGVGRYDLENNGHGYQGEYLIAPGLSGGYAFPFKKNINLEFSFGVGYVRSTYRAYEAMQDINEAWHLYKQNEGRFIWFGPTKLKVSVVWFPHIRKRGGKR